MQDLKPCHISVLQRAYLDLGKAGVTSMWIAEVFYILYDEATDGCILGAIVHQAAVLVLGRHEATALAMIEGTGMEGHGRAWMGKNYESTQY